ncbi:MAG: radical SAM protein [bacterium]
MRIALVIPKVTNMAIVPNLGLGYLAASLLENGFGVEIFHCGRDNLSPRELARKIRDGRFNITGIQSLSFFHDRAAEVSKRIKSTAPGSMIVVGGPHASGVRDGLLTGDGAFDYGFAGEAEIGFTEFVRQAAGGGPSAEDIPGLIWRDGGSVFCNDIKVVRNLDALPMPPWNMMDPNTYPQQAHGMFPPDFPVAPMIFSRGCNYNCAFCASRAISGAGIRYRSVENTMREIEYIYNELRISAIAFLDQNPAASRKNILQLCAAIAGSDMKIKWYCPNGVRLDSLDGDVLEIMRAAGCVSLTVGIESASEESLKAVNREPVSDEIRHKLALIRKHRIKVTGNFIIGLPNETLRDFKNIILKAVRLPLNRVQYAFFVPFPGTALFKAYFPDPEHADIDWSTFDVTMPSHVRTVPKALAWFVMMTAFALFYIRPGIMLDNIRDIKSAGHLRFILSRILKIASDPVKWMIRRKKPISP